MTVVGMSVLAILLIVAAIVFLVAELFLPTHGLLAISSAVCAIAAVVFVMQIDAMFGLLCAIVLLVVSPFAVYRLVKVYPSTPVGRRVLLGKPFAAHDPVTGEGLLGVQGRAITILRPAGVVEIHGKRVDCVSEGDVIDAGRLVTVVSLSNGRVVVRESAVSAIQDKGENT